VTTLALLHALPDAGNPHAIVAQLMSVESAGTGRARLDRIR
jgi:hypothetical protein